MYELIVRDSQLRWHNLDLLPGEEPAMNYQVNDIAELKDRQANYSQNIKLPKSPKNVRVLEALNVFEANTLLPYRTIQCRLYSNGFRLAGKGAILIIDRVGDYIECHIRSGNVDFFETMNNRLMEDADLGSTIVGSGALPQWVKNVYCINGELEGEYRVGYHYCYNLFEVVRKLVEYCGYTLETDLPTTPKNWDWISLPSMNAHRDSLSMFNSEASYNVSGIVQYSYDRWYAPPTVINNGLNTLNTGDGYLRFTSNITGKIKLEFNASGDITSSVTAADYPVIYEVKKNTEIQVLEQIGQGGQSYNFSGSHNDVIEVSEGDIVEVRVYIQRRSGLGMNLYLNLAAGLNITEQEAVFIPLNGRLYFANNTGFDSYLDLFKEFCRTYGLTVSVDNNNKVVKANTMDKLYQNKGIAKDWSVKLSKDNTEMLFISDGYGQNNFLRFEKAKIEEEELEEKGNFYIDNKNIEKWKDLFTLKWESGKDVRAGGLELAYIPIYEYSLEGVTEVKKFKGAKPHLVRVMQISTNPYLIANHITAQSLLDNYYDKLISRMLVKARTMNVELVLNEQDIEELDYFTPIYLKQFGAYFYISKISNFISNKKLTKVELIKL